MRLLHNLDFRVYGIIWFSKVCVVPDRNIQLMLGPDVF